MQQLGRSQPDARRSADHQDIFTSKIHCEERVQGWSPSNYRPPARCSLPRERIDDPQRARYQQPGAQVLRVG
ncbi:MAG: hypothetical protein WKG07_42780 [Hymenobacter sp.]